MGPRACLDEVANTKNRFHAENRTPVVKPAAKSLRVIVSKLMILCGQCCMCGVVHRQHTIRLCLGFSDDQYLLLGVFTFSLKWAQLMDFATRHWLRKLHLCSTVCLMEFLHHWKFVWLHEASLRFGELKTSIHRFVETTVLKISLWMLVN
jgi:hypothetical protein